MGEGTSGPSNGEARGTPLWLGVFALCYTVAWILGAFLSLYFDWPFVRENSWIWWTSIAVLAVSVSILAREMGFFGTRPNGGGT
jgi:lipopolysaccharide export LptBFGC system permease protein LptF